MKTSSFMRNPDICEFFPESKSPEMTIIGIGYHNFHYLTPQKYFRSQKFYTIHLVLSGKGTLCVNNRTYPIRKDTLFVLPNDTAFCYYPDKANPWEYIFFECKGTYLEKVLADVGFSKEHPVYHYRPSERTMHAFLEFFSKKDTGQPFSYYEAVSLPFVLLSDFDTQQHSHNVVHEDTINLAKRLMRIKYLDCNFNIDVIAKTLHIAHAQLARSFKKATGETMVGFLNNLRMSHAEKLLRESELTISEVCYASGYQDYNYFLTLFKRIHGITTKQYRQAYRRSIDY